MSIVKSGIKLITDSNYRFLFLVSKGLFDKMDDRLYLEKFFEARIGRKLNLDFPKTFNEKLQWLKLHDRKPKYTTMVDKYVVKMYVADKIGEQYIIPTLGVWDTFDEIDFDKLPNKFVMKCTHDSGGLVICRDKVNFDKQAAKKKINRSLRRNYYYSGREWPYKNVPPRIIAEQYMEDSETSELKDYKFMCFNGKVKCSFVCSDRFSHKGLHVTFFDRDWNVLPFDRHYPRVKEGLPKPINYIKMIELAEILSKNIPFVRVDFYEVNKKIYFGELTFYPGSGLEEFTPEKWDRILGDWLVLPKK